MSSTQRGRDAADAEMRCACAYARGMVNGSAAADIECADVLDRQGGEPGMNAGKRGRARGQALIFTTWAAWEASGEWAPVQPLAEEEEYFVGWVHGYSVRIEQIDGVPALWTDAVEGNDPSSPLTSGTP